MNLKKVFQLRLDNEHLRKLRAVALMNSCKCSALIRVWIEKEYYDLGGK